MWSRNRRDRLWVWPVWAIVAAMTAAGSHAQDDDSTDGKREQIAALIDELGHHSPEVREEATERLLDLGPAAIEPLREAVETGDLETVLRAKALLDVFDQLLFAGAAVRLEVSADRIDWDDPVELIVRIANRNQYAVHLPFESLRQEGQENNGPARQVANMLDVAEYLQVTGPDGGPVSLRVDDIRQDDEVRAVVDRRADDPPVSDLPPGREYVHRVKEFNRGWARYPLLESGTYRIQLVYQPEWSDEELTRAQVGRVESNIASITVREAAPEVVRSAQGQAGLQLKRAGEWLVLSLQNVDDRPAWVNTWVNRDEFPPGARVTWYARCEDSVEEFVPAKGEQSAKGFTREALVELEPAGVVELQRVRLLEITRAATCPESSVHDASVSVRASYANLTSFAWQRDEGDSLLGNPRAPKALQTPLPKRMLTATVSSNELVLERPK